jgi:uroporphyrinogen decarboxylase
LLLSKLSKAIHRSTFARFDFSTNSTLFAGQKKNQKDSLFILFVMNPRKPLLDVLHHRNPERRPVWLMRQAGRYLPEYRELRAKAGSFLSLCYNPEWAAEVTLQPLRRFDLDAAILFSDILVVPHAMGLSLDFKENEGPVLSKVASLDDVEALNREGPFPQFDLVCETVARVKAGLAPGKTLIGFCGAPWTVASYMIEGGSSKRLNAKYLAERNEPWFEVLMARLVDVSVRYLMQQIEAGAEAIQIFDSWAGDLSIEAQRRHVEKPIAEMVARLKAVYPDVPVIVFARGVGGRHGEIARASKGNAVSVEQDVEIGDVLKQLPAGVAVQGNLDPHLMVATEAELSAGVDRILGQVPMARHVFNLGHGIMQQTDPSRVGFVIDRIRKHDHV